MKPETSRISAPASALSPSPTLRHLAGGEGDVRHAVELLRRVDHAPALEDEIVGHCAPALVTTQNHGQGRSRCQAGIPGLPCSRHGWLDNRGQRSVAPRQIAAPGVNNLTAFRFGDENAPSYDRRQQWS